MTVTHGDAAVRDDHEARLFSQTEFRAPLVLEAGAGTGKTTALVARIVAAYEQTTASAHKREGRE